MVKLKASSLPFHLIGAGSKLEIEVSDFLSGLRELGVKHFIGYKCDILPACLILAYSDKIFVKQALSMPGLRAVHLVQRAQL